MVTGMSESESVVASTEHRVMDVVAQWLNQAKTVWLCTIVKTWGSSPRPAGSMLAYQEDCGVVGSLSGGCIEDDLIHQLRSIPPSKRPIRKVYGVDQAEVERFLLPCGGKIELILEYLSGDCVKHFYDLERCLVNKEAISRRVSLSTGEMQLNKIEACSNAYSSDPQSSVEVSAIAITHHISPAYRLLIVGLGEVAIYLAEFAKSVEFNVCICEPRKEYIQRYAGKSSDTLILQTLPDDLIREKFNDPYCAIVTVAHDPRVDDLALLEALNSSAFYIGAMGSLKTSENRISRLNQFSLSQEALNKLHAPIGLSIGSKTPPEIAISIISELVLYRHNFKSDRHK